MIKRRACYIMITALIWQMIAQKATVSLTTMLLNITFLLLFLDSI